MRQIIWSGPIRSYLCVWYTFVSIAQSILKNFCSNVACGWYKFNHPATFSLGIIKALCNLICCNIQCCDGTKRTLTFGLNWALWLQDKSVFLSYKNRIILGLLKSCNDIVMVYFGWLVFKDVNVYYYTVFWLNSKNSWKILRFWDLKILPPARDIHKLVLWGKRTQG